ncbi:MAG: hypothetical protein WCB68_14680, partial [Pyrinomonadaceae bacterium]
MLTQNSKEQANANAKQSDQSKQDGWRKPPDNSADTDANALRERISKASPDERQPIAEALPLAENNYPKDYRFPYEHAKMTVAGSVHHHAFNLLYIAGQRAIDAGEADLLLADLEKHKDAEFQRCSKGHDEWTILEDALRKKDKKMLETAMNGMHRDLVG